MSDYPAGTVAIATVRGTPNVKVVRVESSLIQAPWVTPTKLPGHGAWMHGDDVTDVRPLVVLDHSHILDALTGLDSVANAPIVDADASPFDRLGGLGQ